MSRYTRFAATLTLALAVPALMLAQPAIKREPARPIGSVEGDALYNAYCAVCHGKDGKGGGPAAQALKGPMPDLTTMARRNKGVFSSMEVERMITGQGQSMAAHGSEDMPVWGPIFRGMNEDPAMAKLRVSNLVKYLGSMQVK